MSCYAIDYFLTLGRSKELLLHFQSSIFGDVPGNDDDDDDVWNESYDEPWQIIFNLKYEALPINRYPEIVSLFIDIFQILPPLHFPLNICLFVNKMYNYLMIGSFRHPTACS